MKMIRSLSKRLPYSLLCRAYHYARLREESKRTAWAASITGLPLLKTLDMRTVRTSDTLFVLGSAWSINNITEERWKVIARHDSIGLNFWLAHPFVPQILHFENLSSDDQPEMYNALRLLLERRSKDYANTVKILTEVSASGMQQLIFNLPAEMEKNLYVSFSMPVVARDVNELCAGIRFMRSVGAFSCNGGFTWLFKYGGSVIAAMTLGVLMGHRRIVLCGVDLNRHEYFYQHRERYPEFANWEFVPKNETHLTTRKLPWLVPAQQVVWHFKELVLDPEGIELFVESRDSTLYPKVPLAPEYLFRPD
jgi:hypothetical protein